MASTSVDASSTSSMTRKKPNGRVPNLSDVKLNVLQWEDDELALRCAAENSRLYADRLTSQEAICFPDVLDSKSSLQLYLFIRNKIVQIWQLEPNVEATIENVTNQICAPYNSDKVLIKRVFGYLLRYGFINYGNFHRLKDYPQLTYPRMKKIVVLGGGIAGITAYLQLMNFGFEVVMVEGLTRLGGRCHTYSSTKAGSFGASVDLGANVIFGIKGNPLNQLLRQISVTPDKLRVDYTIYDEQGKEIDELKDKLVLQAFRRIVKCSRYLTHNVGISEIDGKPLSLQKSYDSILDLLEYRITKRLHKFWKAYANLVAKAQLLHKEVQIYTNVIAYLGGEVEAELAREYNAENQNGPVEEDDERRQIVFRCQKRDLIEAYKRHTLASERLSALQTTIINLSKQEPSEVYMNVRDRRVLEFHYVSMENACGTSLSNISARHYEFGNLQKMPGSNITLREGIGELVERFGKRIYQAENTKLGSVVDTIEYNMNGVNISGYTEQGRFEEKCDAVLVTVPLGVLKGGLEVQPDCPRKADNKGPVFFPPLPEKNANAIRNMGFGSTNKIVLFFDKPFWNKEMNTFVHLNKAARGEMFVFSTCPQQNAISATFSATAPELYDSNAVIVSKAMSVLQRMFGTGIPKVPTEAVITRWNLDGMSLGISSFIPPGGDSSLFDDIAMPVKALGATGEREGPEKVFFAGEHTSRRYGGTLQGAMLSGMREAARIADLYLGRPFARSESGRVEEECVVLDDSDDDEDEVNEEPPRKKSAV